MCFSAIALALFLSIVFVKMIDLRYMLGRAQLDEDDDDCCLLKCLSMATAKRSKRRRRKRAKYRIELG